MTPADFPNFIAYRNARIGAAVADLPQLAGAGSYDEAMARLRRYIAAKEAARDAAWREWSAHLDRVTMDLRPYDAHGVRGVTA